MAKVLPFQKALWVFITLVITMLCSTYWLVSNGNDIHVHRTAQTNLQNIGATCDQGYNLCTNNPQDILGCLYSSEIECINYQTTQKPLLFSHTQGAWSDLGDTLYLKVTKSKSLKLNRLYYDNLFVHQLPQRYYVLMNQKLLCDSIYIQDVNHTFQAKAKDLLPFQCDIRLQTREHANTMVDNNQVAKWYADNDNYIDVITSKNVIISGIGRTDFWNNCTNEYYQPRERCGQPRQRHIIGEYKYVINIAQSHGYFHFLVEEVPRLAGLIYMLKELAATNYSMYTDIDIFYINVAWSGWHFLQFIFRNEIKSGTIGVIEHGKTDWSNVFAYNLIQPHASPCLFARRYGSMLLNQIIRKEIQIYADENEVQIYDDTINIVMIKRKHHRRWIKNFDDLKDRIVMEFINGTRDNKYGLYVHDDLKLKEIEAVDYYIEFYKADIVLGAFGAGLTNIVWCKPGTAVIMIEGTNAKNHRMYMHHSTALGMRYYGYLQQKTWNVNIDDIVKILKLYI
eukprot:176074_1